MREQKEKRTAGWKKGLLTGLLGLAMVLLAAQYGPLDKTERESEDTAADEMEDASALPEMKSAAQEGKRIALTFDDGPHPYYTEQLLDGLAARGVKATFFLLGCNLEGREDIVRRMAKEGHLLGNHTYAHTDITKLSQEEACEEIRSTSDRITAITGQPVEYVRPPFGSWNRELECEVMLIPVFWSVDPLDWNTSNADRIVESVVSEAEDNDIILLHDSYKSSVEAALRIVDLLQAEGFEFVTADELILE